MKLSKTLKLALAAFAAVALISTVQADSFDITVGASTTSIAIPPTAFTGTIGDFDIDLMATINATPPPNNPALDLAGTVTFTGTGPATITLCVAGNGFVPLTPLIGGGGGFFTFENAAHSGGSVFQTISANGVPVTGNTATLSGTIGGFSVDLASITPSSAPFSLEDCITITFNGPGFVSFDVGVGRGVPDSGATMTLLGLGLLGIGAVAKFRKANAA
jgi:VPDSG-CTERM exosortase interaction domain